MGNSSIGALGKNHTRVKIDSDVIKTHCPLKLIPPFHLVIANLPDSIAERAHKVLSEQTEVRVKVDVGVCIGLGGEVGSEEGPLFHVELFRCGVDGYSPEILQVFCGGVKEKQNWSFWEALKVVRRAELIRTKMDFYLDQHPCYVREHKSPCLTSEYPP